MEYETDYDGTKHWRLRGALHRVNGPAVEYPNGTNFWYQNGELHRLDGPAIEFSSGGNYWFQKNKRHRIDGPAIEDTSGTKEWWIEGMQYDKWVALYIIATKYKQNISKLLLI